MKIEAMRFAALLIPTSLEPRQAVRLRRLGVATLTYALTAVFVGISCAAGMMTGAAALQILLAYLAINAGLYAAIRSGFNLRFKDPSLTRFQIIVGITMVMFIAYNTGDDREIVLFGCFLVFLFGIFRLTAREFVAITLYTLMAYGIVMVLLLHTRPEVMTDLPREMVGWLLLAGFLPCFNIIGAQFNALRLRVRESEARYRSLTEMSSDFHWETDTAHRLRHTTSRMPGGVQSALGKRRWELACLTPDAAGWRAHRAILDARRPFRAFELSRLADDGTEQHVSISGDPIVDAAGAFTGYRGVGTDISARKRDERALRESAEKLRLFADRIQRVAHHDSLTGLPNRLLFDDRLDQAVLIAKRGNTRFALLYIDLDQFKPVNDTFGHAAGDELLKAVASRIRRQVRESDTVARLGGDEFAVVLLDVGGREHAEAVAAKIVAALALPMQLGGSSQREGIGASIGIAIFPDDAQDAESLVAAGDAAMYLAKELCERGPARHRGGPANRHPRTQGFPVPAPVISSATEG